MELKAFVTETIKEIIEGVVEAQNLVIPRVNYAKDGFVQIGSGSFSDIEFDISITASESEGNESRAGVFIKVVDFGLKNNNSNNSSSVNKIKFKVPITLPIQSNQKFT